MNKRLKELAEQAGFEWEINTAWVLPDGWWKAESADLERFAELVRQDLYPVIGKSVIEQVNSAVQMEREACAKVCDGWTQADGDACAEAIRARSEPSPAFKNYMGDNWAGIV